MRHLALAPLCDFWLAPGCRAAMLCVQHATAAGLQNDHQGESSAATCLATGRHSRAQRLLVNTDFGGQRADPKTMHHDSKSPRYGGISQLPRTRSSGCLSACPPALVNTERFPFVYPRQRPARRRDAGGGGKSQSQVVPWPFPDSPSLHMPLLTVHKRCTTRYEQGHIYVLKSLCTREARVKKRGTFLHARPTYNSPPIGASILRICGISVCRHPLLSPSAASCVRTPRDLLGIVCNIITFDCRCKERNSPPIGAFIL